MKNKPILYVRRALRQANKESKPNWKIHNDMSNFKQNRINVLECYKKNPLKQTFNKLDRLKQIQEVKKDLDLDRYLATSSKKMYQGADEFKKYPKVEFFNVRRSQSPYYSDPARKGWTAATIEENYWNHRTMLIEELKEYKN